MISAKSWKRLLSLLSLCQSAGVTRVATAASTDPSSLSPFMDHRPLNLNYLATAPLTVVSCMLTCHVSQLQLPTCDLSPHGTLPLFSGRQSNGKKYKRQVSRFKGLTYCQHGTWLLYMMSHSYRFNKKHYTEVHVILHTAEVLYLIPLSACQLTATSSASSAHANIWSLSDSVRTKPLK